ncbi:hypothetical protein GEV33_003929 [Tenebrio molitor]|uniref:Uncharacterized protein n=1 Tax=Tenebrio molitor TaxID=7067 RepID=A0A8J6HR77_TENMO|nr:hypothetical protein GEV33_003929 [Tenebrio molitor]
MFDREIECTPPEIRESAQKLALNILPEIFATGAIVTPLQSTPAETQSLSFKALTWSFVSPLFSLNKKKTSAPIRGRIRGCDSKTLYHTYKSYIRPVIEYRAPIYATLYPALLHQIFACERRMFRRIFRLPDRFPTDNLHQETNTMPIQSRLKELQSRYVTRILNSNNALAIQTLSTSFKYPSRDGHLLNRIPKILKRKLKHPPTALLSPAYTDLPDDLQELVDSTPLTMR